jgi:ubiquinone/menaquinone biosynthesis C-methylase UbiE
MTSANSRESVSGRQGMTGMRNIMLFLSEPAAYHVGYPNQRVQIHLDTRNAGAGGDTVVDETQAHQRLIVDQFTKQAVPFAQMPDASPEQLLAATEVGPTDTVLDAACGPGVLACAFAQVASHVTGIDLTPAMIEQARALQQSHRLANLTWRIGHVLPLPFADDSFSLVVTRYSFHHFLDPKAVLAQMVRVCAPGGRVAVVDVFTSSPEQAEAYNRMEKLRDPSHVRALSLEELTGLFHEAGLQNVRRQFYKHAFGLEPVLQGSFPNPGDAYKVRRLFEDDLGVNRLGLGVHRKEGDVHFAYPIVILVGHKRANQGRSNNVCE